MPDPFSGKTYWLVGASEGLGRALAKLLDAAEARLVLSARNEERLKDLAGELADARIAPMDVSDLASVKAAAVDIGPIDGVIYNAGFYEPVKATEWDSDAVLAMTDVNFTGALRVLGEAMPILNAQDSGHVVLIGSLAGFRGLPGAIGYGASKSALMHLAENIKADLRGTQINVQCINPGFIRTRLTAKNDFDMPMIMSPDDAAEHVMKRMRRGRFSTSFPAPFAWFFQLGRHLPLTLFHAMIGRDK